MAELPGVLLYQGLAESTRQLTPLITAVGTALALGGGMMFGEYIATIIRRGLRLADDPFYTPLFADPIALKRHPAHQDNPPADSAPANEFAYRILGRIPPQADPLSS